jgi:hypothetical protein
MFVAIGQMQQILSNLISNATNLRKPVVLKYWFAVKQARPQTCPFNLHRCGYGDSISDMTGHDFQPFVQAESSTTRNTAAPASAL